MAATADPRAQPPAAASHHPKSWAAPRAHRVPSLPDVSGAGARDHQRGGADTAEEPCNGRLEDLVGRIRDAADRLHLPQPPAAAPHQQEVPAARPWNLRDRKRRPSARAAAAAAAAAASFDGREPSAEKVLSDDRVPFAVALTAEEVEEDVYALTGARPRRRPRKRPRIVQRQLDTLFPGLWLTEITADAYKVPDE